jgi:hypothetical protein
MPVVDTGFAVHPIQQRTTNKVEYTTAKPVVMRIFTTKCHTLMTLVANAVKMQQKYMPAMRTNTVNVTLRKLPQCQCSRVDDGGVQKSRSKAINNPLTPESAPSNPQPLSSVSHSPCADALPPPHSPSVAVALLHQPCPCVRCSSPSPALR